MRKFDEIVKGLATVELNAGCHASDPKDYDNILDFYLESVKSDTYECFVEENVTEEEIEEYGIVDIINGVEKYIRENYEEVVEVL